MWRRLWERLQFRLLQALRPGTARCLWLTRGGHGTEQGCHEQQARGGDASCHRGWGCCRTARGGGVRGKERRGNGCELQAARSTEISRAAASAYGQRARFRSGPQLTGRTDSASPHGSNPFPVASAAGRPAGRLQQHQQHTVTTKISRRREANCCRCTALPLHSRAQRLSSRSSWQTGT